MEQQSSVQKPQTNARCAQGVVGQTSLSKVAAFVKIEVAGPVGSVTMLITATLQGAIQVNQLLFLLCAAILKLIKQLVTADSALHVEEITTRRKELLVLIPPIGLPFSSFMGDHARDSHQLAKT